MKDYMVLYESATGFTKQYAQWIAEELGCEAYRLQEATGAVLSDCRMVIFGGWTHAGSIKGLKKAKTLFAESKAEQLILFATGATPGTDAAVTEAFWGNNLTQEELGQFPHFYLQGGLRYEKMKFGDKLIMKMFATMMKNKKDKTEMEQEMAQAIEKSYDASSKEQIGELIAFVTGKKQ